MFTAGQTRGRKSLNCWQSIDASLALSLGPAAQGDQESKPDAEGKARAQAKRRARKVGTGCIPRIFWPHHGLLATNAVLLRTHEHQYHKKDRFLCMLRPGGAQGCA